MKTWLNFAGLAVAVTLAGCTSNAADNPSAAATVAPERPGSTAVHPESGLAVIPLTVTHDGKSHNFRVEVARTGPEQGRGLMFRTQMGKDEGMIFPMDPPRHASFWMKNTVIPLDIIYVGTDGKILNIFANTTPYSETPLPSDGPVKGVLELNGGRAAELGIGPGDHVSW